VNPTDELQKAAAKLRKLAEEATSGSWRRIGKGYPHILAQGEGGQYVEESEGLISTNLSGNPDADALYIEVMQPRAGLSLATWLDVEAATWAGDEVHYACKPGTCTQEAALDFARMINGGEE
jgi:hypothetical protein